MSFFFKTSTDNIVYFVCINRRSPVCILASRCCVCEQRYACMSKDLIHLIVTEYIPYTYFCHTLKLFWLQSWASTAMPRRDIERCMLGSCVTWSGPWWTWFYYIGPVSQTASQSGSLGKRLGESGDTRWQKGVDWMAVRQVFCPFNHTSTEVLKLQDLLRGLQRRSGWGRTSRHTRSTDISSCSSSRWDRKLLLNAAELRHDHTTGVNKTSITGTLWKVLIPD